MQNRKLRLDVSVKIDDSSSNKLAKIWLQPLERIETRPFGGI